MLLAGVDSAPGVAGGVAAGHANLGNRSTVIENDGAGTLVIDEGLRVHRLTVLGQLSGARLTPAASA